MLVARKAKSFNVSPAWICKLDWKAALSVADFHPRMLFLIKKSFLQLANTGVKSPFFQISWLKLQKILKSSWPSETKVDCGELFAEKTLFGLPQTVKAVVERMKLETRTII